MNDKVKTWWDGNSTRAWRLILIAWIGTLSFLGGYIFQEVTAIPKVYAERKAVTELSKEMRHGFECLGNKIDDINEYLRK